MGINDKEIYDILFKQGKIFQKGYDLPTLMKDTGYLKSRNTFDGEFKRAFGMPCGEFIKKHRLDKAMAMLKDEKNTNLKVADIVKAVGYSDVTSFSKSFFREFRMNIGDVRPNIKTGSNTNGFHIPRRERMKIKEFDKLKVGDKVIAIHDNLERYPATYVVTRKHENQVYCFCRKEGTLREKLMMYYDIIQRC